MPLELKSYDIADTDLFDHYIRVKKKDSSDFKDGSFNMTEIDMNLGIYAVSALTKGDETVAIHSYLFIKEMWNEADAQKWAIEADKITEMIALRKSKDPITVLTELVEKLHSSKEDVKNYSDLKELKGIEIFAVGKWNNDNYTLADLKEMEANFPKLKGMLQPFVKLGHDGGQKLLQKDGYPAAGWIENIYVQGDKLLADIVDMPKKIYELIKNKAYKRVSSEIYWNLKDQSGKVFKRALKAVALLGGDTPAVGSLADVQALYTKRYVSEITADETKVYDQQKTEGEKNMDELKVLEAKNAELTKKLEATEKKFTELEESTKKLEKDFSDLEFSTRKNEIVSKVEGLIESKKLLPAQKDFAIDALVGEVKSYTDINESPLVKMFESNAEVVDTTEKSEEGEKKDKEDKEEKVAENIQKAENYSDATNEYLKGGDTNA